MTPRQYAAAEKRLKELYAQKARAEAPIRNKIEKNSNRLRAMHKKLSKKHEKEFDALDKQGHRLQDGLIKKLQIIDARFEKRISAIARKLS